MEPKKEIGLRIELSFFFFFWILCDNFQYSEYLSMSSVILLLRTEIIFSRLNKIIYIIRYLNLRCTLSRHVMFPNFELNFHFYVYSIWKKGVLNRSEIAILAETFLDAVGHLIIVAPIKKLLVMFSSHSFFFNPLRLQIGFYIYPEPCSLRARDIWTWIGLRKRYGSICWQAGWFESWVINRFRNHERVASSYRSRVWPNGVECLAFREGKPKVMAEKSVSESQVRIRSSLSKVGSYGELRQGGTKA